MPIHIYECEKCDREFELIRSFGDPVGTATCTECGWESRKVWRVDALPAVDPNITPYFDEQLGVHISSRAGIKQACKDAYERSEGQLALDWH